MKLTMNLTPSLPPRQSSRGIKEIELVASNLIITDVYENVWRIWFEEPIGVMVERVR